MSALPGASPAGAVSGAPPRTRRRPGRRRLQLAAVLGLLGVTGALVAWKGVFLSRDWLFLWILLLAGALSLGDLRRWARGVVFDWLPLMGVLLLYDLSSVVRDFVGVQPFLWPQLRADLLAPGASVPAVELQRLGWNPADPALHDYLALGIYLSHFFVTLLVAVALWRFAHHRFRRFRAMIVTLATAGFVTYVLFPAVPPWLAAEDGHLPPVDRTVGYMWTHVGLQPAAALFQRDQSFYNDVAAMPSLHAAYPVLLAAFLWAGVGRRVRVGLVAYALAMAVTLVYTGEHYVADILVGWAYGLATFLGVSAVARRREGARGDGLSRSTTAGIEEAARREEELAVR